MSKEITPYPLVQLAIVSNNPLLIFVSHSQDPQPSSKATSAKIVWRLLTLSAGDSTQHEALQLGLPTLVSLLFQSCFHSLPGAAVAISFRQSSCFGEGQLW
jgi:hypothetical protein